MDRDQDAFFEEIARQNEEILREGPLISIRGSLDRYLKYSKDFSVSPWESEASLSSCEYLARRGISRGETSAVTTMVAYIFPAVTSATRLSVLTILFCLEYHLDDLNLRDGKEQKNRDRMVQAMTFNQEVIQYYRRKGTEKFGENPEPSNTNYVYDITKFVFEELQNCGGPKSWFHKAQTDILKLREHYLKVTPVSTLSEYCDVRELDSGVNVLLVLIEYSINEFIPYDSLSDLTRKRLEQAKSLVGYLGWASNDVLSYYKEIIKTRSNFNMIYVIMVESGLNLREAFDLAFVHIRNKFEQFVTILKVLREQGEVSHKYLNALEALAKGFIPWQTQGTRRYNHPKSIIDFNN